jgi:hypothetical protein
VALREKATPFAASLSKNLPRVVEAIDGQDVQIVFIFHCKFVDLHRLEPICHGRVDEMKDLLGEENKNSSL